MISQLGGRDNIVTVMACATNRLRFTLQQKEQLAIQQLTELACVNAVMEPQSKVVHLLLNEDASPWASELNQQLSN
ncbi:PTS transporter subunit EIIB [Neiella sp. HB171785]|uniref:PTS transporter subunit EIIB n=1 Tax=Neiella litorisoli TaxID=2771431 RepID=A0A8J6QW00_9GAMM|nr:PTS transporter subunit EIIB [Neiella litorisoli]MBD1391048.1 PTS transporter subunit EIIB [Neiella litorisoli]